MTETGADDDILRLSPGRRAILAAVLRALATTVVLVVLYFVVPFDHELDGSVLPFLLGGLAVAVAVIVLQTRAVVQAPYPGLRALEALAASLPLFLLVFSISYVLIAQNQPGSFDQPLSRIDSLYFTVTVFATVGFGDIVARTQPARAVVTLQMVADLVLVGISLRVITGAVKLGQERRAAGVPARSRRHRS